MLDKILLLSDIQVSHAYDTFVDGCITIFGKENIFEYPYTQKYHSNHTTEQHPYAWWCYNDLEHFNNLSLDSWADEINNGNIRYIVATNRETGLNNLLYIIPRLNADIFKKICIIFLEEEEDHGFELHRYYIEKLAPIYNHIDIHYRADYMTKRVCSYDKIMPFYLSGPTQKILNEIGTIKQYNEREIDICFMAGSSHPNRKRYFDILKKYKLGNNIIEFGNYVGTHTRSINEYFNIINNAKIFISCRGNGWGNTRNVEGPLCGAALFTETLDIVMPFDYKDGESAIFFNEINIIDKLNYYMNNKNLLYELAKYSNKHALEYHTSTERVKQMIAHTHKVKEWQ